MDGFTPINIYSVAVRSLAPPSYTNDLDDPHNANDAHHAQQAELDPNFQEEAELGRVCWMFPEFPGHFNIFQLLISPTLNIGPMAIAGSLVINMGSVTGTPWVLSRLEIPHVHRINPSKGSSKDHEPCEGGSKSHRGTFANPPHVPPPSSSRC